MGEYILNILLGGAGQIARKCGVRRRCTLMTPVWLGKLLHGQVRELRDTIAWICSLMLESFCRWQLLAEIQLEESSYSSARDSVKKGFEALMSWRSKFGLRLLAKELHLHLILGQTHLATKNYEEALSVYQFVVEVSFFHWKNCIFLYAYISGSDVVAVGSNGGFQAAQELAAEEAKALTSTALEVAIYSNLK
jgi:hypothetical protein